MDIAQNQQNNNNVVRYDYVPVDCLISSVRGPTVTDVLYLYFSDAVNNIMWGGANRHR